MNLVAAFYWNSVICGKFKLLTSRCSAATYLKCDEYYYIGLIAKLSGFLVAKEFWNLVKI